MAADFAPEFGFEKLESTSELDIAQRIPARKVLSDFESAGPSIGWRDGFLSEKFGFMPPDVAVEESARALQGSAGSVWAMWARRLPALVDRLTVQRELVALPMVDAEALPDIALHAAATCLGLLVAACKYEHGFSTEGASSLFEPLPALLVPWRIVARRTGRPDAFLCLRDYCYHNWVCLRGQDPSDVANLEMRWPAFREPTEASFLLTIVAMMATFAPAMGAMVRAQEAVVQCKPQALARELLTLTQVVGDLKKSFLHLSVRNAAAGSENYCSPMIWGKTVAKFTSAWTPAVPGMSGLQSPVFHALDEFFGRTDYTSFLGKEALHLREWFAPSHRDFIAALGKVSVGEHVAGADNNELKGIWRGLLDLYAGDKGLLGVHRYKVYGFLEQVFRTGRSSTNGGASMAGPEDEESTTDGDAAQAGGGDALSDIIHQQLELSRIERYRSSLDKTVARRPGTVGDCPFRGHIVGRCAIASSSDASTRRVSIKVEGEGLTYSAGDHVLIVPHNPAAHVQGILEALQPLGLTATTPISPAGPWVHFVDCVAESKRPTVTLVPPSCGSTVALSSAQAFVSAASSASPDPIESPASSLPTAATVVETAGPVKVRPCILLGDLLRHADLRRVTRPVGMQLGRLLFKLGVDVGPDVAGGNTAVELVRDDQWPAECDKAELLRALLDINSAAGPMLSEHATLCALFPPHCPRTYSISSAPPAPGTTATSLDLTVTRAKGASDVAPPVCSSFLNPPTGGSGDDEEPAEEIMIGVSSSGEIALPAHSGIPVIMICGGSGIGPFRSMLQELSARRNEQLGPVADKIFIGVRQLGDVPYTSELEPLVRSGRLIVHVALSRDKLCGRLFSDDNATASAGSGPSMSGLVPTEDENGKCYIDQALWQDRASLWEYMSCGRDGGWEASVYVCGSVAFSEETVVPALNRIGKEHGISLVSRLVVEGRLHVESFGVPPAPSGHEQRFGLSELCKHTSEEADYWIAIDAGDGPCVYDVTPFLEQHPGSAELIIMSCGTDATRVFRQAGHHFQSRPLALLGPYYVGLYRPYKPKPTAEIAGTYQMWTQFVEKTVQALLLQRINFDATVQGASNAKSTPGWQGTYTTNFRVTAALLQMQRACAGAGGTIQSLLEFICGEDFISPLIAETTKIFDGAQKVLISCASQPEKERKVNLLALHSFFCECQEKNVKLLSDLRDVEADVMRAFERLPPDATLGHFEKAINFQAYVMTKLNQLARQWKGALLTTWSGAARRGNFVFEGSAADAVDARPVSHQRLRLHGRSVRTNAAPPSADMARFLAQQQNPLAFSSIAEAMVDQERDRRAMAAVAQRHASLIPRKTNLFTGLSTVSSSLFSDADRSGPEEVSRLLAIAQSMALAIKVKDRRYRFRLYKSCFLGCDAVMFLVGELFGKETINPTQEQIDAALHLGNKMIFTGLFHHVVSEHLLENTKTFFRFSPWVLAQ